MTPHVSPDCEQAKHAACSGDAWDHELDEPTLCTCDCHAPKPPTLVAPTGGTVERGTERRWEW